MCRLSLRVRIFIVAVLIVGVPIGAFAAIRKSQVGAVVAWSGIVYVDHVDTGKRIAVESQEPVFKGDIVVTDGTARAKLLMNDDSILALGPNSSLKVQSYETSVFKGFRSSVLSLSRGSIRSMVNRYFGAENSGFKVVTPNATAGIKGTDFIIKDNGDGAVIVVINSKVVASSSTPGVAGEVIIEPGYMSTVNPGMAPSNPVKATKELMDSLFNDTEIFFDDDEDKKTEEKPVTEKKADTRCVSCHAKVVSEMDRFTYRHPNAEKSCEKCHLAANTGTKTTGASGETVYPFESDGGLVLVDVKSSSSQAVLSVKDSLGKEAKSKALDIKASIKTLTNDKTPPVAGDIAVTEVVGGVFSTATMEFKTDELATAVLEYGESSDFGFVSRPQGGSRFYSVNHKLKMEKLKSGEKYYVRAVVEDVFGNRAYSKTFKVKVDKPFTSKPAGADASYPTIKSFDAVRVGDKVGFLWSSGKPVIASIALVDSATAGTQKDPHAPGLANVVEVGSFSCDKCHSGGIHRSASHPIGQMKWAGKSKDRDLPYDTLGNMMCSTCHPGHGSNFGFMLRKERDKLCTGCHL